MNELSDAQYAQLQARVNNMPWDGFKEFLGWTYKGRSLEIEDFPAANEGRKALIVEYLNRPRPNPVHDDEWKKLAPSMGQNVADMDVYKLEALKMSLESYVAKWKVSLPMGNHVDEVKKRLEDIREELKRRESFKEEDEWSKVDKFSIDALEAYYKKYPNTCHLNEIDDTIFSLSKGKEYNLLVKALQRYIHTFPAGKHKVEAEKIIASAVDWQKISVGRDLLEVYAYIQDNPDSPFINEAQILLMELKSEEITRMKRDFVDYPRESLLHFLRVGLFSKNELIYADVVTNESLDILSNYSEICESLPNLNDIIPTCHVESFTNHTDVFLFGIPGTGKSCVLTGLLGAGKLNYDSVLAGGPYADALTEFLTYNCPPPPTKKNYLTTIKATASGKKGNHFFNLVEMAGEEFADKIAMNPDGVVDFGDMGTGATELLGTDNRKVFFIVVDPTKDSIRFNRQIEVTDEDGNVIGYDSKVVRVSQRIALKRMVDMFNNPTNAKVMKKVDAIHFIVTKADTLGDTFDTRLDRCADVLLNNHGNSIETLKEVCRHYGIDRVTDFRPEVYPFSLGHFYVGNIFEYDSADSDNLIEVMKGNTVIIKKKTFWDKIRQLMNPN